VNNGRKLCIAVVTTQLAFDSAFLPMVVFALLFCNICAVLVFEPYILSRDNRLESALLTLALLSYLASTIATVSSSSSSSSSATGSMAAATSSGMAYSASSIGLAMKVIDVANPIVKAGLTLLLVWHFASKCHKRCRR